MMSRFQAATDVLVRNAIVDESPAIASVLKQAFAGYEPLYTPAAFAATTPTSLQIQQRWHEGPVWVAIRKDNIVGTVSAVPKIPDLYVRSMAVLPTATDQGIGGQLLDEIERFALDHHYKSLFLSTTPFLKEAIRLYGRFGFQRSDNGPHDLFGTPLFTMIKSLSPTAE